MGHALVRGWARASGGSPYRIDQERRQSRWHLQPALNVWAATITRSIEIDASATASWFVHRRRCRRLGALKGVVTASRILLCTFW